MINDAVNTGFQLRAVPVATPAPHGAAALSPAQAESSAASIAAADVAPTQPVTESSQLEKAVTKLNDYVQNLQRKLSFSVSAETGRTIIKVYDAETDELIRQIPPDETIRLADSIDASSANLFVKERV
jgi:flagellar protein FlaG